MVRLRARSPFVGSRAFNVAAVILAYLNTTG
jgi:hypothetical protein